jgi:hypothetical protein
MGIALTEVGFVEAQQIFVNCKVRTIDLQRKLISEICYLLASVATDVRIYSCRDDI